MPGAARAVSGAAQKIAGVLDLLVDVLRVGVTLVLIAGVALTIAAATLYPTQVAVDIPGFRAIVREETLLWCPGIVLVLVRTIIFIWRETPFVYPDPEYYSVAAEVLAVILIALIVERKVLVSLSTRVLVAYGLLFVLGEVAAFVAISGSVKGASEPFQVAAAIM